jgi:hypothetical protein
MYLNHSSPVLSCFILLCFISLFLWLGRAANGSLLWLPDKAGQPLNLSKGKKGRFKLITLHDLKIKLCTTSSGTYTAIVPN